MSRQTFLHILVFAWLAVFVGSILMAVSLDGPRNLDTGLRRLDILVTGQAVALVLALAAGGVALFGAGGGRRQKLIGLAPIAVTLALVGGLAAAVMLIPEPPGSPQPVPKPTAPAE